MTARTNINVLLRSEDSGGRVALVDNRVPAGTAGPPLHRHDFDEAFVVLEGEVTFQLGDDLVTRRAGESRSRRGTCRTRSPTRAGPTRGTSS